MENRHQTVLTAAECRGGLQALSRNPTGQLRATLFLAARKRLIRNVSHPTLRWIVVEPFIGTEFVYVTVCGRVDMPDSCDQRHVRMQPQSEQQSRLTFLAGGGEMGARMREMDCSRCSRKSARRSTGLTVDSVLG